MVICVCNYIKEEDIKKVKLKGAKSIEDLADALSIDWSCCKCIDEVEELLKND